VNSELQVISVQLSVNNEKWAFGRWRFEVRGKKKDDGASPLGYALTGGDEGRGTKDERGGRLRLGKQVSGVRS
jgi:hypothetical protein